MLLAVVLGIRLIYYSSEEKELVTVEDETTEEMQLALESLKAQRSAVTEAILGSLEETTMGKSWHQALETEFSKPYFTEVLAWPASLASCLAHRTTRAAKAFLAI